MSGRRYRATISGGRVVYVEEAEDAGGPRSDIETTTLPNGIVVNSSAVTPDLGTPRPVQGYVALKPEEDLWMRAMLTEDQRQLWIATLAMPTPQAIDQLGRALSTTELERFFSWHPSLRPHVEPTVPPTPTTPGTPPTTTAPPAVASPRFHRARLYAANQHRTEGGTMLTLAALGLGFGGAFKQGIGAIIGGVLGLAVGYAAGRYAAGASRRSLATMPVDPITGATLADLVKIVQECQAQHTATTEGTPDLGKIAAAVARCADERSQGAYSRNRELVDHALRSGVMVNLPTPAVPSLPTASPLEAECAKQVDDAARAAHAEQQRLGISPSITVPEIEARRRADSIAECVRLKSAALPIG